jgi:hypothetical protein
LLHLDELGLLRLELFDLLVEGGDLRLKALLALQRHSR